MSQINRVLTQECYRAAIGALLNKSGVWKFGVNEWVPDEFEHLERLGLVRCAFGLSDAFNSSLRERVISLTQAGKEAASQMTSVRQPAHVRFSFHAAMQS